MTDGFRKIDIGKRVRQPQPSGDAPEMIMVPIRSLLINDAYQRAITGQHGWKHIEAIAANFDWALFVPVVVAPVGDGFALIDGQHRAHAAYLAGYDDIPAISVEMSPTEQARAFAAINTQVTRMSSLNVYKAALAAREPWALDADCAVSNAGCRLMTFNKSTTDKRPGEVYAVTLIQKHIKAEEAEVVTACLAAIRKSDDVGVCEYYHNAVLKGFFEAVSSNVQFLRKLDLVEFCRQNDLLEIHEDAGKESAQSRLPKAPIFRRRLISALDLFRERRRAA